jgi:aminoglycoside phosphotransferase (APT) family kinase protein
MNIDADSDATTAVRAGLQIDAGRLESWMRAHVADFRGPLALRQFKGGQSNPTYLLETPGARYVLRRKPPGALLASAHAVDREFRVLEALGRTEVPVPAVLGLCTDEAVIGTWFYVMQHVAGRIFWDPSLPQIARDQRARYFDAMNSAIASLHRVDYRAAGLEDFGRSEGYVARQISRWSGQYLADEAAGRVAAIDRLIEWLPRRVPASDESSIVHGDYRCDNLIFDPHEPRVAAILDWELSTIGHPIADFAYHLMMYRMPTVSIPGLLGRDLGELGIPGEQAYIEAYCRRTGRRGIPDIDFYLAFCLFRLAAIFHGIRGRVLKGTAVSARAKEYAQHVETIAELGWRQAERAERGASAA